MKKSTKWILGIVIGLLVVAIIVAAGFLVMTRLGHPYSIMNVHPFGSDEWREMPRFVMPMQSTWWFGGLFFLRWILGGLFWVGVIFLSVVGAISLLRGKKTVPASVAGAPQVVEPLAQSAPAESAELTCPQCQHTTQSDWKHCPYCGNALA